jgi:tellurite resistance-related uncharacterized protein
MTKIKGKFTGDKYFPYLDPRIWHEIEILKDTDQFSIIKYKKEKL